MGEFIEKVFVDVWWCRGFGVLGKREVTWGRGEKPRRDVGVFVFNDLEFKFAIEVVLKVNAEIEVQVYWRRRVEDTIVGTSSWNE